MIHISILATMAELYRTTTKTLIFNARGILSEVSLSLKIKLNRNAITLR